MKLYELFAWYKSMIIHISMPYEYAAMRGPQDS